MTPETIQLDPWILPILVGTLTPILTGIVTRFDAYYGIWRPVGGGAAPGAATTKGWIG